MSNVLINSREFAEIQAREMVKSVREVMEMSPEEFERLETELVGLHLDAMRIIEGPCNRNR